MNHTSNPFEGKATDYEQWFKENPFLFSSEVAAIQAVLPSFQRAVEIGAGTGLFSQALGISEGVEPSEDMGKKATEKGIVIYPGFAEDLPLENESFDLAVMITVDCFLQDIKQAFSEIHRILKSNGYFVIAFINKATPLGAQYEEFKAGDPYYHTAHFHTADEMNIYLNETGFSLQQETQTVFTLENCSQEIKAGTGEGVFTVFRAQK